MTNTKPSPVKLDRVWQVVFVISLLVASWYLMQAVHELGHVLAALVTGGTVQQIVMNPLEFSRTDIDPNPSPGLVVWAGPIIGCLLPLVIWLCMTRSPTVVRKSLQFFAGFCLIANGGYIGMGAAAGIGDCGEMLRTGTPSWAMHGFGLVAVAAGLYLWHRLGSVQEFWRHPEWVTRGAALSMLSLAFGVQVLLAVLTMLG